MALVMSDRGLVLCTAAAWGALVVSLAALAATWVLDRRERR